MARLTLTWRTLFFCIIAAAGFVHAGLIAPTPTPIGTGTPSEPWARSVHAAQAGVPLAEVLLNDLKEHAKFNPGPVAQVPRTTPQQSASQQGPAASGAATPTPAAEVASAAPARVSTKPDVDRTWRDRLFSTQQ